MDEKENDIEDDTTRRRKGQILCSAINRIAMEGVRGARLKDIANDAGVSLGLVQHYFRARETLVDESFAIMMGISSRSWNRLDDFVEDPMARILAGMRLQAFGSVDFPARWSFWSELWTAGPRNPTLQSVSHQIYADWNEGLSRSVDQLISSGRIPVPTVRDPALAIMAVIDGLGAQSLVRPDRLSPDHLYQHLRDIVCAILAIAPDEAERLDTVAAAAVERIAPEPLSPELIERALMENEVSAGS